MVVGEPVFLYNNKVAEQSLLLTALQDRTGNRKKVFGFFISIVLYLPF